MLVGALCAVAAEPPLVGPAARLAVTPSGEIEVAMADGAVARFAPVVAVLSARSDPNLEMRWGRFPEAAMQLNDTGSIYNVLTWGRKTGAAKTAVQHVEDGFDPTVDRGYGGGRTANLFAAGTLKTLRAEAGRSDGRKIVWDFPSDDTAAVRAELDLPPDGTAPRLRLTATVKADGWYSFGYLGAPETPATAVEELWQPLIYNERRFPHESFLEAAYRCPLPTTLVTHGGVTTGVLADPAEYPFQPLPNFANSRFGVALRNARGLAQPMLFAPLLGGAGSRMKAGETREFVMRVVVAKASLSATYERVARSLYGFADVRHNALGSLNATFERMLEFGLSDYAKFNADLRGFAYDTDVPGAVKNVSALHPLGLALVTDRPEIYTRLARPLMEFFVSRERFLFTTDPKVKGQSASSHLRGLGAPLTEYANLYAMSGKRTPFFRTAAESLFGRDRILNLQGNIRGDNWSNALGLYRATGEKRWLDHAIKDADAYLKTRVGVRAADYSDPDSRGLFFWTAFTPQWIELFELYEETKLPRFLDAAHAGARDYAQFVWLAPRIPDGDVRVNEDGLAPAYRSGPRFPRIKAEPETVSAWRTSEIGLTSESAPTSKGARGIFLACYAPWMLRIAAHKNDAFLHDIARSAIIGRYTSFPGYHINTARTTAYEKPDFARRGKDELNSTTSIHYNHIWPHIALLLDYLVADAFAKSRGAIDFPSRYAEGYGYLQQRVFGDRPGKVHDESGLYLWMPRDVLTVDHPELNFVMARGDAKVAIALTNQSKSAVKSHVTLSRERIALAPGANAKVTVWENNRRVREMPLPADARIAVDVAAAGITTVIVSGVAPRVEFQDQILSRAARLPAESVVDLGWRGARGVVLSFGAGELTSAYVYLPDQERTVTRCTVHYRQGGGEYRAMTDISYPYDFTLPVAGDTPLEFWFEVQSGAGPAEKSPVGRLLLK
ncbi:MAG: hypothetical protein B9S34_05275 [Opitutia bacterium Tous-C1TDCM]|nr:MAG: hypothetical protein B9S34_05275 [Opitutae bacterium Tous-C1TDCM]